MVGQGENKGLQWRGLGGWPKTPKSQKVPHCGIQSGPNSWGQNTAELTAAVFGLASAVILGFRSSAVVFEGDSSTALSWVGSFVKSPHAVRASVLLEMLTRHFGIATNSQVFKPSRS